VRDARPGHGRARRSGCSSVGVTVRPCVPVAAVVGCVVSAINEGSQVASGHAGWLTWVRIGFNFVVPFLVSSYGYLTAARVPDRHPSQRAAG
jgi:hypothetical protein